MSARREAVARARAGGKVILLGEHAVVYGSRALALGLGLGAEVQVGFAERTALTLGTERYVMTGSEEEALVAAPARAFCALLEAFGAPPIAAEATLEIPPGAGLGASAALGVALGRAIVQLLAAVGQTPRCALGPAALAWENVFHGNASGVDTAASELGGCLSFRRGEAPRLLELAKPVRLVIGQVEAGASTRRMVEQVAARRAAHPAEVAAVLEEIDVLVEQAELALGAGEHERLGALMSRNHELLRALGVSTPQLDRACQSALREGALGVKLTGSGGGGCAVALIAADAGNEVVDAWRRDGITCWEQRTE